LKNTSLRFHERLGAVSNWLNRVAGAVLVLMMLLVNANVILRPLGLPIWGAYELVGFMGSVVLSFALIQTTYKRGHMAVEIVLSRLPPRVQAILSIFNRLAVFTTMSLIAWQSARFATRILHNGEVSATLRLPYYPFLYAIGAAFGVAAVIVLVDLLKPSAGGAEK
jgi:TRAP-type C4-dicarboxylate transport system permease small subunit